ncbi:MAG: hypothetical protein V1650_00810 [Candidatus Omnitrophota bacterium]
MRDLLFKNLTSLGKKRRIISSSEVSDNQGIHSVIRRHFICIVKEVPAQSEELLQTVYVRKERNTQAAKERFLCRIKGSSYAESNGKLFLLLFTHSLNIELSAIPKVSLG